MSRFEDRRQARDGLKALATGRQPLVAAVDLGASKVSCFIMKPDGVRRGEQTLTTAGVGYVQSRGVKGGVIVNTDETVEAIAQAVERAETVAGGPSTSCPSPGRSTPRRACATPARCSAARWVWSCSTSRSARAPSTRSRQW